MNDARSFSERMRAGSRRTWDAVLGHRFFREVAMDAVESRVFARYLDRIWLHGHRGEGAGLRSGQSAFVSKNGAVSASVCTGLSPIRNSPHTDSAAAHFCATCLKLLGGVVEADLRLQGLL